MENKSVPNQPSRHQKLTRFFFGFFLVLSSQLAFFLVKDRCSLINCEPADWSKIQEIVIDNTKSWGNEYRLERLHASIVDTNGITKNDLQENFEFQVYYVIKKQNNDHNGRVIYFDDKNLWVRRDPYSSNYSDPPEDSIDRFQRVLLSPREIYELTWDQADSILNHPITVVSMLLSIDSDAQDRFGIESYWYITYFDGVNTIAYWVDAQSGKIVNTE